MEGTMLRIVVERSMHTAALRCSGRIVFGTGICILRDAVMCEADKRIVLLDLAGVEAIDAAGLGLLAFLHAMGYAVGFTLQLVNPIRRVRELLELTRLDSVLEITLSDETETQSSIGATGAGGHFRMNFERPILIKDESMSQPERA